MDSVDITTKYYHIFNNFWILYHVPIYWDLFLAQNRSIWVNVLYALKKMRLLLLLVGMFYSYHLGQLILLLKLFIFLLILWLLVLAILERGILKYATIILDLSIPPFSSNSFYYMYFEAVLLDSYIVRIVMSSWWITLFSIIKWLFISDIYFDINKATPSLYN